MLKRKNSGKGIGRTRIARPLLRINKREQRPIKVVFLCIHRRGSALYAQRFRTFLALRRHELAKRIKVDYAGVEKPTLRGKLKDAAVVISPLIFAGDNRFSKERIKELSNGAHIVNLVFTDKGVDFEKIFDEILRHAGAGKK